jgi:succinate dehydrogenase hydrophobic anchor subunit
MSLEEAKKNVANVVASIVTGVVLTLLLSFILMTIWNILLPDLFGFKQIAYYQAVGLFIMCKILFRDKLIKEDCNCHSEEI